MGSDRRIDRLRWRWRALVAACIVTIPQLAAADPQKLTIGVFAPSVEFGTAQARLAYAQALARAVEQTTGVKAEAQSYASLAALEKDKVDFAILDAACVATHGGWRVLASATIGGSSSRPWGLFSLSGEAMQTLRGKKLAFVQTGCNDAGFVDNAMLESEVDAGFFGGRLGEKDVTGAVADVASYKTAQAVFAPTEAAKGLKKVFDTIAVPNPAFVALDTALSRGLVDQVTTAVLAYGGGGAITAWGKPSPDAYRALAAHLQRIGKAPVLASPDPVRIDANNVLIDPSTVRDYGAIPVRTHFIRATRIE